MLEAIYIIIALQILILVLVPYLVLRRWTVNRLERYAETRTSATAK